MCNQETHTNLSKPAHFMRHSMEVERACTEATRRGLGSVSVEQAMLDAQEALSLADSYVTPECTSRLQLVSNGDLLTAAQLRAS
jgi:hypothetical protein